MGISSLVGVLVWARTHHVGLVGTSRTEEGMQVPVRSPGLGLRGLLQSMGKVWFRYRRTSQPSRGREIGTQDG